MIIFSGPSGPKFMADALVVSENVGEGGPGEVFRRLEMVRERRERARGIVVGVGCSVGHCGGRRGRPCLHNRERLKSDGRKQSYGVKQHCHCCPDRRQSPRAQRLSCAPISLRRWMAMEEVARPLAADLDHNERGPVDRPLPERFTWKYVREMFQESLGGDKHDHDELLVQSRSTHLPIARRDAMRRRRIASTGSRTLGGHVGLRTLVYQSMRTMNTVVS